MSKADDMFKELGFEQGENSRLRLEYVQRKEINNYCDIVRTIIFDLIRKEVHLGEYHLVYKAELDEREYYTGNMSMQELQAINEKVKELRLDRRRR